MVFQERNIFTSKISVGAFWRILVFFGRNYSQITRKYTNEYFGVFLSLDKDNFATNNVLMQVIISNKSLLAS